MSDNEFSVEEISDFVSYDRKSIGFIFVSTVGSTG